jgi:hypothetical protein
LQWTDGLAWKFSYFFVLHHIAWTFVLPA